MLHFLTILPFFFLSFSADALEHNPPLEAESKAKINWLSWEEAVELNKKEPRKIYVDIYTTWCGPCKKMDRVTFKDKKIVQYMNEHFYAVKFNAEQKEDLNYDNYTFRYRKAGYRGVHEFAASLLNNKMSYPSSVFLTEEINRVSIVPGYLEPGIFLKILKYHGGEHYKKTPWEQFKNEEG